MSDAIYRYFKMTLAAIALLGSASCLNDPSQKSSQTTVTKSGTTVDSDYIGAYPSMTQTPDGRLHAVYYAKRDWNTAAGGALRHAVRENGIWIPETVEGDPDTPNTTVDVGQFTSIAADATGALHVAYWDVENGALKYARLPPGGGSGQWQIETVDTLGAVCQDADLMLDPMTGNVSIAYCDGTQILVATKNGGWSWETAAPLSAPDLRAKVSIQFVANGDLHVAYFDPALAMIRYTARLGGVYQPIEDVAALTDSETRMSLTLDGLDHPHVVFYDIFDQTLLHAYWDGSAWTSPPQTLSNVGDVTLAGSSGSPMAGYLQLSSLMDNQGRLRISYFRGPGAPSGFGGPGLRVAMLRSSDWMVQETETIGEAGDVGRTTSMTEDNNGTIHIVYRNNISNDMEYQALVP
jgi:hypothetical protein